VRDTEYSYANKGPDAANEEPEIKHKVIKELRTEIRIMYLLQTQARLLICRN